MDETNIRLSAGVGADEQSAFHKLILVVMYVFLASIFVSIAVNSIALGLIGILWTSSMVTRRRWIVTSTPLDLFFLAYIAAELLATLFSQNQAQSLLFSKRLLLISVVYLFATHVQTETVARRVMAALLGTAAIVGSLGILKLLFGDAVENTRLGIFQFYMTTAELMMMAGLLLLPFLVHPATPRKIRVWSAISLIPILVSLYATVTKGSYLAFILGSVFIAFVRNKKLLVPIVAVVLLVLVFGSPYVQDRISGIFDVNHPENASRIMLWKTGLRMFADHPLFGIGDVDMHELYLQYMDPGDPAQHGHFHNMMIQFLVTLGLAGFIAVSAMFVKIVLVEWNIFHRVKDEWFAGSVALGSLAVFVGFQVNGLTEWSFGDQEVVLLFWTSLGMALALANFHQGVKGRNP